MTNKNSSKYPTYDKHPLDDFSKNGYCRYLVQSGDITPLIKLGKNISKPSSLVREHKDAGSLKVEKIIMNNNSSYYSELLSKTGLFQAVQKDVDEFIFPRKISHLVNDELTKSLRWHRDSYRHKGKQIGPRPSPLKLAIYLTNVDKYSGVTGINKLLYNMDFNNRYLDTLLAYLLEPFAYFPQLSAGSAMLFDGRLLHCRSAHKSGHFRHAIIFSLSRDVTQLPKIEDIPKANFNLLHTLMKDNKSYGSRVKKILQID